MDKKLKESIRALEHALTFEEKARKDPFYAAGIAKSFETSFEYCWKYFKQRAISEGFEVFSPREAIKTAGILKLIDDVEKWMQFQDIRNRAVHDYIGVTDKEYIETIKTYYREVNLLKL